jgi:hypothetical protein
MLGEAYLTYPNKKGNASVLGETMVVLPSSPSLRRR